MSHSKRGAQATAIGMICVLLGVISFEIDSGVAEQEANEKAATSWEKAERSPLIPYPETVTYTLAKMTASGLRMVVRLLSVQVGAISER